MYAQGLPREGFLKGCSVTYNKEPLLMGGRRTGGQVTKL